MSTANVFNCRELKKIFSRARGEDLAPIPEDHECTAEFLRRRCAEREIRFWVLRKCSGCGDQLGFLFPTKRVFWVPGCNCLAHPMDDEEWQWDDFARFVNTNRRLSEAADFSRIFGPVDEPAFDLRQERNSVLAAEAVHVQ